MRTRPRLSVQEYRSRVILHSQKRAKERYDIYKLGDVFSIARMIKTELEAPKRNYNKVFTLYRETKTSNRWHYIVNWNKQYYWVVWNGTLQTIQTFMPTDGLQHKIPKFTNSVIAYLSSRGLIDTSKYRVADVMKVSSVEVDALANSNP